MRYRRLGRTGLEISEVGFGAWGISGRQWIGAEDETSRAALRRAIELGLNFIDTARAYGDGHSEELVGQVVRETRTRVYVATKVPPKNQLWPARPGIGIEEVFPYEHIVGATEASLRSLSLETVDLQQLHVWNPQWIEREEWREAVTDLKKAGKIRYFGISINDHQPDSALEVLETGLVDAVQVIYNIFDQSPEWQLFPACQRLEVGVLARVPLDEGGLTGNITASSVFPPGDFRAFYFRGSRKEEVAARVAALERDLADEEGTMAEKALRFCLSHPAVTTVIPGMRRVGNVESSCRVSDLGPLKAATLRVLRRHAWARNFYV